MSMLTKYPTRTLLIFALALGVGSPIAEAATVYSVTAVAGANSDAYGVNDLGQVTGYLTTSGGTQHAFIWDPTTGLLDLGSGTTTSVGLDINNSSNVVGQSGGFAFRWTSGSGMVTLDVFPGTAHGINSSGTVLGTTHQVGNDFTAQWDSSNNETVLFPLTPNTQGYAISNSGERVGRATVLGIPEGYYSDGSSDMPFTFTNLHNFLPDDINNLHQVVGTQAGVAAMYNAVTTAITSLGKLNPSDTSSEAYGINDNSQIVGVSQGTGGFIWDPTSGLQNLTSELGAGFQNWTILSANDINNNGQIVGLGELDGQLEAVILTPEVATVPEPPSLILAASAACTLLFLRRRLRHR